MNANSVENSKYTYIHDLTRLKQLMHITLKSKEEVQKKINPNSNILHQCVSSFPLPSLLFGALLMMLFGRKRVVRESVVIMPTLGVQLVTLYKRGKVVRRFVPAAVILKPVLQECVTPVTCYRNWSLLLHGEEEPTLIFKEVRPPLEVLIPSWKALWGVSNNNCPETSKEENNGDDKFGGSLS